MRYFKIFLLIILSFTLGMLTGSLIKVIYESKSFKPYEWKNPPVVANCYGDDFSEEQMNRAIKYWERKGHSIAFYEHKPPDSICKRKWTNGFIIIRKDNSLRDPTLAETKRMTRGSTISGAIINYRPGSQNLSLINEHELGHALGFSHVNEDGHIMHPIFHKMSEKFWVP